MEVNIVYKIGEDTFNKSWEIKVFVKCDKKCDWKKKFYGGHFVFWSEAKVVAGHVSIGTRMMCKFGEDILKNGQDMKVYVLGGKTKTLQVAGHLVF